MRWTMKPVVGDMTNDNTIIAEFKIKMAMMLRGNENIEDLRFRPAAMVKNFEPKTRRRFKGITLNNGPRRKEKWTLSKGKW